MGDIFIEGHLSGGGEWIMVFNIDNSNKIPITETNKYIPKNPLPKNKPTDDGTNDEFFGHQSNIPRTFSPEQSRSYTDKNPNNFYEGALTGYGFKSSMIQQVRSEQGGNVELAGATHEQDKELV